MTDKESPFVVNHSYFNRIVQEAYLDINLTGKEQAMVDRFAQVLKKHFFLSKVELIRLAYPVTTRRVPTINRMFRKLKNIGYIKHLAGKYTIALPDDSTKQIVAQMYRNKSKGSNPEAKLKDLFEWKKQRNRAVITEQN